MAATAAAAAEEEAAAQAAAGGTGASSYTIHINAPAGSDEQKIAELIKSNPKLTEFGNQIQLEKTTDGLHIQIVDQQNRPMFDTGSSLVKPYMRDILQEIGKALRHPARRVVAIETWVQRAERIHRQRPKDKNKLYALHAPEAECISKVRREVANIIVSPAHKVGDETGRSVDRSLPVHALLATASCEATGTKCRALGATSHSARKRRHLRASMRVQR